MRRLSKMFVIAVGLLAVIVLSSSLYANDVLGTFTLSHPTQWNNTMLGYGNPHADECGPAYDSRRQADAHLVCLS